MAAEENRSSVGEFRQKMMMMMMIMKMTICSLLCGRHLGGNSGRWRWFAVVLSVLWGVAISVSCCCTYGSCVVHSRLLKAATRLMSGKQTANPGITVYVIVFKHEPPKLRKISSSRLLPGNWKPFIHTLSIWAKVTCDFFFQGHTLVIIIRRNIAVLCCSHF